MAMGELAGTVTVASAAPALYTGPSRPDGVVRILNLDTANGIWVNVRDGDAASVEGADCVFVPAGRSWYGRWMAVWGMVAVGGDVKVNMESGLGRSW